MRSVETSLDEIFAFRLSDKGLKLSSGEGIDQTRL